MPAKGKTLIITGRERKVSELAHGRVTNEHIVEEEVHERSWQLLGGARRDRGRSASPSDSSGVAARYIHQKFG